MHAEQKNSGMEKRVMTIKHSLLVAAIALALGAGSGYGQSLLNGGFESGTPPTPSNWTLFNGAVSVGTNCPGDANNNCYPTYPTVHGGNYSLKTYGPFNTYYDACGVYQDVTPLPSVGTTWKLSGYLLNSGSDPLSGSNGFGVAQIKFLDGSNTEIQTNQTTAFGLDTPLPVDQLTAFQVLTTVPPGAATMRIYLLHVGLAGAGGSVWWDDLTLTQRTGVTNVVAATSQSGVQIAWPTQLGSSYQVRTASDLSTSTTWSNSGPAVIGSSNTNQVFRPFGADQRSFFRIQPQ